MVDEEQVVAPANDTAEEPAGDKAWYVVNTYSTHERKVADNLARRVETYDLGKLIFRIIVAEQDVPVLKDGVPTGPGSMETTKPGFSSRAMRSDAHPKMLLGRTVSS